MSNFQCEHCGAPCLDSPMGYATGCEHYPRDRRIKILTLRLKAKWWNQIASGEKTVEMRLATPYWRKRLIGIHYDEIHLWLGYPSKNDTSKLLRRKWQLVAKERVLHEEFGELPVEVFIVDVSRPI